MPLAVITRRCYCYVRDPPSGVHDLCKVERSAASARPWRGFPAVRLNLQLTGGAAVPNPRAPTLSLIYSSTKA
jgi:hypothetical protein